MTRWLGLAAIGLALGCATTAAAQTYRLEFGGELGGPVVKGEYWTEAAIRTFRDNTTSAAYGHGFYGADIPYMSWGAFSGPLPPGVLTYSYVDFFAEGPQDVAVGETFRIGSLRFYNGTSSFESIIFGGELSLSAGAPEVADPEDQAFKIWNTQGGGTPVLAADYLEFDGIAGTLHAYEGHAALFDLYGELVDEPVTGPESLRALDGGLGPRVVLSHFQVRPGWEAFGFIGDGHPGLAAVPEPRTWALMIVGFAAAGALLRRRRLSPAAVRG